MRNEPAWSSGRVAFRRPMTGTHDGNTANRHRSRGRARAVHCAEIAASASARGLAFPQMHRWGTGSDQCAARPSQQCVDQRLTACGSFPLLSP
jgi:hypothetical protein